MSPSSAKDGEAASPLTAQRLRKRELDRRAQRTARTRTKNRIAHLENLVETFRRHDENGAATSLMEQLRDVSAERDRFVQFLHTLDDSIKTHLAGISRAAVALDIPNQPADEGQMHHQAILEEESQFIATGVLTESSTIAAAVTTNMPMLNIERDMDFSLGAGSLSNFSAPPPGIPRNVTLNPATEGRCSESDPNGPGLSFASRSHNDLQETSTQPFSCPCASSRTRRLFDGTEVSFNIWRAANEILRKPADPKSDWDIDSISDDIIVRAVLEGWDSVAKTHRQLSSSWDKVRQLDDLGFAGCSQTERLGILRMINLLMHFHDEVTIPGSPTLPQWFDGWQLDYVSCSPGIGYLPWAGVRKRFIQSQHRYCQNIFWHLFREHVRIVWPFEFRDCYTQNVQHGRYHISSLFEQTIRNPKSWTMEQPFFGYFPELHQEIPTFLDTMTPPKTLSAWELSMGFTNGMDRSGEDPEAMSYVEIESQMLALPLFGPARTGV